jgi:hypothetical protein
MMPPSAFDPGRVGVVVLLHGGERRIAPVQQVVVPLAGHGRQAQQRRWVSGWRWVSRPAAELKA